MNKVSILFVFLALLFASFANACEKGSVIHPESGVRTCIEHLSPKDNLVSQDPAFYSVDKIPEAWKEFNEGICKRKPDSYAIFKLSTKEGLPTHVELVEANFSVSETSDLKEWLLRVPWLYELTIEENFFKFACPL